MPNDYNTSHNEISPELQGSILWGILGSVTGMIICILVMLLCSLCQMGSFSTMLQLFVGLVIGWFYRLFHGQRSKTAAYVTVGICTVSASVLWAVLLALLLVIDLSAVSMVDRSAIIIVMLATMGDGHCLSADW